MRDVQRAAAMVAVLGVLGVASASGQQPGMQGGTRAGMGGEMGPGQMGAMGGMGGGMGGMDMAMGGHGAEMARVHAYEPGKLLEERDRLGLTAAQAGRLEVLTKAAAAASAKAQADHDSHHAQVMRLFEQAGPDPAQVKQHALAALQAQGDGHAAQMVAAASAKALLTPEQRARVEGWVDAREMMQAEMVRRQARMQSGQGAMQHGGGMPR